MIKRLLNDFFSLLFPRLCGGCGTPLFHGEDLICTKCMHSLPFTDFHLHAENQVAKKFWGRVNCDAAMAMFYFKKGTKVQHLIHGLKYKNQTELGVKLGKMLGDRLSQSDKYSDIDYIIPVPLHPKKERKRGYNQSQFIAEGIALILEKEVNNFNLTREIATESQTKKAKYTRFENMQEVFSVVNPEQLANKHILLVDDVITTGATLEACALALLNSGVGKVSIAALATAE
ncbi:MAG: ComF family protein [Sphingobacteriaceae bacterium]|nr:ComF family protein [Sphingobacteriaceae bacterium]